MIRLLPAKDLHRSGFVARVFALRDVVLADLSATSSKSFTAIATEADARISVNFDDTADAVLTENGATLSVHVRFTATATHADQIVMKVASQFDLRYERQVRDASISDDDANLFAKINGVYNAWPYMRELVANTFTRMGYPPFTMESLVIGPQPDDAKVPTRS